MGGDAIKDQPSALPTSQPGLRDHRAGQRRNGTRARHAKRYPVVVEQTGTGYSAFSPDVSGCVAVGGTEEETRRNLQDALMAHFEAMREVGEPIPEPHTSADYGEVAA